MLGGNTHDISIMDSSTEIGLMLARDKYGRLIYREKEMAPLSFMQAAGYVDESSQNPQVMYPLAFQKSWVSGFGQYFMRADQPRRYFASYGVDASEEGVLKLGPDWTAVNWPTVTTWDTLANLDLETWSDADTPGSWTEVVIVAAQGNVTREGTTIHGGTYAAKLDSGGTNDTRGIRLKQSATWATDMQGKKFRFQAWGNTTNGAGNMTRIGIYDGVTYTYTNIVSDGTYAQFTVEKTLAANATELTFVAEAITSASTERILYLDDCSVSGYKRSASHNAYAEYNNLQYLSAGDILYKANSASAPTSWTYVDNFKDNITALYPGQVAGVAYLFIMVGAGNTSYTRGWYYDGSTMTQMTDGGGTDSSGDYITSALTTFYISGRPTGVTTGAKCVIRTNTAPLAGAWSADTQVGDPNTSITGLLTVNGVVYIPKEDSLWYVKTDGTVDRLIDYRNDYTSTSGKNSFGSNNKVYVPVGTNKLLEYDPGSGTFDNISPATSMSGVTQAEIATAPAILSAMQSDFDGRIMAGCGDGNTVWILQDNGSVNNLYKGQYANIDTTGWHWHPVANTTMADVNCMAMSVLTGAPIIWVGHGTGNPGYYNLATYETSDPTYTVPCLITPYYSGGVWRMMKALYSIILGLESITANVYITLQYRFYGSTSWADALTFDGASGTVSNGQDSNYMPANSYGTAVQFRLNFVSNSASATPKVTRISGEGVIKPTEVSVIECTVLLQDNCLLRTGGRDTMPASKKKSSLNTIRASNWPVTFYDIEGSSFTVDLISREDATAPQRNFIGNTGYTKTLLLKKVTLT